MKVNELKALFQKNGVFQNIMPPVLKTVYHDAVKPQPNSHSNVEATTVDTSPPAATKPVVKNNDFLNELNKKLMNKSLKSKVVESHTEQTDSNHQQSQNSLLFHEQRVETYGSSKAEAKQEELNFDDIMNNAEKRSVFRSGFKARFGINERHPISQEEEQIFSQLQIQKKESMETAAKQNQEILSRNTQMYASYRSNPLYSKLSKADKVKRIDRIINTIFCVRQSDFASRKMGIPHIIKLQPPSSLKGADETQKPEAKYDQTLAIETPSEISKNHSDPVPNRSMFAMSKEMLSQMNMRIKRRQDMENEQAQERKNERSVSPFSKKKKTFEKFEDS